MAIHAEISNLLGADTVGSSTMIRYLRKPSLADSFEGFAQECPLWLMTPFTTLFADA
jgi:hypothetical protein